jgi:hypothetical protein
VDPDPDLVTRLAETADRFDQLAEVAELMGDEAGALRFRRDAARCRDRAMGLLDGDA